MIDNSLKEKRKLLLFLYKENSIPNKRIQVLLQNEKVRSFIKDSMLFYKINIKDNPYFDNFYFGIKQTVKEMPYFYNNYLLATLELQVGKEPDENFLNNLTRMENVVYDSLVKEYYFNKNHISPKEYANVSYEYVTQDLKKVRKNDTVRCYFPFNNTGSVPYIIYNVETSCHCVVPQWTRKPILPNVRDSICVLFSQQSVGKFRKVIKVKTNVEKELALFISGEVVP